VSYLKGRHSFKTGIFVEYSGEDDFDQINVSAQPGDTNNQNGRFEFTDSRTGGSGLAVANAAMGLFTNYGEIGQRVADEMARACDGCLRAGQLEAEQQADRRGGPPVRPVAAVACAAQQRRDVRIRRSTTRRTRWKVDPSGGFIVSGDVYNGVVLPGDGFPSEANGCHRRGQ